MSRKNRRARKPWNGLSRNYSKPRRWKPSVLTGGVAHDFNNLLTAILGSLEIAKKRTLSGQNNADLIDNAIQGAKRGAALTQRLLAFSRKQNLKLEKVDLPDLVKEMASLIERTIGQEIEIATTFPLSLPFVVSDPNQLESALLNLVVNARDAMPGGGRIPMRHSVELQA
jgi:signal transduction histidine kinase